MFDAAVDGRLKAMWIFGEDVAQTDPNTTHVVACAASHSSSWSARRSSRTRRRSSPTSCCPRPRSWRSRARSSTPSAASSSSRRRSSRPATPRPTSRSSPRSPSALGHEMGWATPSDTMDEIAALTPTYAGVSHERIGRHGPAVAGRARRNRLADPLRASTSRPPGGAATSRRSRTSSPATPRTTSSR